MQQSTVVTSNHEPAPDVAPKQEAVPDDASWFDVMEADDLWIGDMKAVDAGNEKLLLVNLDGNVRAYDDKCPHKGTPLSDGEFVDGVIVCPTHRWEFCARTGCGVNPVESRLTEHAVKLVDGKIMVALRRA